MGQLQPTTPFGRRPLSPAMMAAQAAAKACPGDATAHKWRVFRNLTEAREGLGVNDRALAVLAALLTFHPETALTPSADLVEAGLVTRRGATIDSAKPARESAQEEGAGPCRASRRVRSSRS